jgi:hypothetical protein
VAEDLGQEDVVGLVLGLEPVAADGPVGASEVAPFPGLVQGTEGVGNVLRELGAGGGVDGIGAPKSERSRIRRRGSDRISARFFERTPVDRPSGGRSRFADISVDALNRMDNLLKDQS